MSWAAEEWKDGLPQKALMKISQMENMMEKIKKERDAKQFQLDSLEQALQVQKRKTETEKSEISDLKRQNQLLSETCDDGEKKRQKLAQDLALKQNQLSSLEQRHAKCEIRYDGKSVVSHHEEIIESQVQQIKSLESELADLREQFLQNTSAVTAQRKHSGDASRSFHQPSESDELHKTEQKLLSFESLVNELENKNKKLIQEGECLRHNSEAARLHLETKLKETEKEMKQDMAQTMEAAKNADKMLQETKIKTQQEINALQTECNRLKSLVERLEQDKSRLESECQEMSKNITMMDESRRQTETNMNELHKKLALAETERLARESSIRSQEINLKKYSDTTADLEKQVAELKSCYDKVNSIKVTLTKEQETLQMKNQELESQCSSLKESLDTKENEFRKSKKEYESCKVNLERSNEEIVSLMSGKVSIENHLSECEQEIQGLKSDLELKTKVIEEMTVTNGEMKAELEVKDSHIASLTKEDNEKTKKLQEIEENFSTKNKELQEETVKLQRELIEMSSTLEKEKVDKCTSHKEIERLQDWLTSLETQKSSKDEEFCQQAKLISDLENRCQIQTEELKDKEKHVMDLKSESDILHSSLRAQEESWQCKEKEILEKNLQIEKDLMALRGSNEERENMINTLEKDKKSLECQIHDIQNCLTSLKADLDGKNSEISRLGAECEMLQKDIETKASEIASISLEKDSTHQMHLELEKIVSLHEAELDAKQTLLQEANDKCAEQSQDLLKKEEENELLVKELTNNKNQLHLLEESHREKHKEAEEKAKLLLSEMAEITSKFEAEEHLHGKCKTELERAKTALSNFEISLTTAQEDSRSKAVYIDELEQKCDSYNQAKQSAESEVEKLSTKVTDLQRCIDTVNETFKMKETELSSNNINLKKEITALTGKMELLEESLREKTQEQEFLKSLQANAQESLTKFKLEVERKSFQLVEIERKYDKLTSEINQKEEMIVSIKNDKDLAQGEVNNVFLSMSELKADIESKSRSLEEIECKCAELNQDFLDKKDLATKYSNTIKELEQQLQQVGDTHNQKYEDIKLQLENAMKEVSQLKIALTYENDEHGRTKKALELVNDSNSNLSSTLKDVKEMLANKESDLTDLEKQCDELRIESEMKSKEITDLTAEIKSLHSRIDSAKEMSNENLEDLSQKNLALEKELINVNSQLEKKENVFMSSQEEVEHLRNQVINLNTALSSKFDHGAIEGTSRDEARLSVTNIIGELNIYFDKMFDHLCATHEGDLHVSEDGNFDKENRLVENSSILVTETNGESFDLLEGFSGYKNSSEREVEMIKSLKDKLVKFGNICKGYQPVISELKTEIRKAEKIMLEKGNECIYLKTQLECVTSEVAQLKETVSTYEAIQDDSNKSKELLVELEKLKTLIEVKDLQIEEHSKELDEGKILCQDLELSLSEIQGELNRKAESLLDLQAKYSDIEQSKADTENILAEKMVLLESKFSKIAKLEEMLSTEKASIHEKTDEMVNLTIEYRSLKEHMATLNEELANKQKSVSMLEDQLKEMDAHLREKETAHFDRENELNGEISRLTALLEKDIEMRQNDVNVIKSDVTTENLAESNEGSSTDSAESNDNDNFSPSPQSSNEPSENVEESSGGSTTDSAESNCSDEPTLSSQFKMLQMNFENASEESHKLEREVANLKTSLADMTRSRDAIQFKASVLEKSVLRLEEDKSDLTKKCSELIHSLHMMESENPVQMSDLKENLFSKDHLPDNQMIQSEQNKLQKSISDTEASTGHEQNNQVLNALQLNVLDETTNNTNSQVTINSQEKELMSLRTQYDQLNVSLSKANAKYSQLLLDKEAKDEQCEELIKMYADLKFDSQEKENLLVAIREELECAGEENDNLKAARQSWKQKEDSLNMMIQTLNTTVADMKSEVESTRDSFESMSTQRIEAVQKARRLTTEKEFCEKMLREQESEISNLKSNLENLKEQMFSKENEILELRVNQVNDVEKDSYLKEITQEKEAVNEELMITREKNMKLEKTLEDFTKDTEELHEKLKQLQHAIEIQNQSLSKKQRDIVEKINVIEEKNAEIKGFSNDLQEKNHHLCEISNKLVMLESELKESKSTVGTLEDVIESLNFDTEQMESSKNSLLVDLDNAQKQLIDLQNQMKQVSSQTQSDINKMNGQEMRIKELELTLEQANLKVTSLTENADKIYLDMEEVGKRETLLKDELKSMREDIELKTQKLDEATTLISSLESDAKLMLDKMDKGEKELERLKVVLEEKDKDLEVKEKELCKLNEKTQNMDTIISFKENELHDVKSERDNLSQCLKLKEVDMQEKEDMLREQLQEKTAAVADLKLTRDKLSTDLNLKSKECEKISQERDDLSAQITKLDLCLNESQASSKAKDERIQSLQDDLGVQNEQVKKIHAEKEDISREAQNLKKENSSIKETLKQTQNEYKTLLDKMKSVQTELESAIVEREAIMIKFNKFEKVSSQLSEDLKKKELESKAFGDRIISLNSELNEIRAEKDANARKMNDLETDNLDMIDKLKEAQSECISALENVEAMKDQLKESTSAREKACIKITELEKENSEAAEKFKTIEKDLMASLEQALEACEKLERDRGSLKDKLQERQDSAKGQSADQQREILRKWEQRCSQLNSQITFECKKSQRLSEQVDRMKTTSEELKRELESLKQERDSFRDTSVSHYEKVKRLKSQVDLLTSRNRLLSAVLKKEKQSQKSGSGVNPQQSQAVNSDPVSAPLQSSTKSESDTKDSQASNQTDGSLKFILETNKDNMASSSLSTDHNSLAKVTDAKSTKLSSLAVSSSSSSSSSFQTLSSAMANQINPSSLKKPGEIKGIHENPSTLLEKEISDSSANKPVPAPFPIQTTTTDEPKVGKKALSGLQSIKHIKNSPSHLRLRSPQVKRVPADSSLKSKPTTMPSETFKRPPVSSTVLPRSTRSSSSLLYQRSSQVSTESLSTVISDKDTESSKPLTLEEGGVKTSEPSDKVFLTLSSRDKTKEQRGQPEPQVSLGMTTRMSSKKRRSTEQTDSMAGGKKSRLLDEDNSRIMRSKPVTRQSKLPSSLRQPSSLPTLKVIPVRSQSSKPVGKPLTTITNSPMKESHQSKKTSQRSRTTEKRQNLASVADESASECQTQ